VETVEKFVVENVLEKEGNGNFMKQSLIKYAIKDKFESNEEKGGLRKDEACSKPVSVITCRLKHVHMMIRYVGVLVSED
jgi:hypothetical protein